jgi:manganese/iron transport system substrate-binding protein
MLYSIWSCHREVPAKRLYRGLWVRPGRSRFPQAASLALMLGVLTSCTASNPPSAESPTTNPAASPAASIAKPKVVATTSVLCDLTKTIAADTIDLTCLLKPGVDAHVYEPVPSDRKAIEDAQLILYSGYDFEPNLIRLIQSTSNATPKVAVAEVAIPKPIIAEEAEHGHHDDHENEKAAEKPATSAAKDPHDHTGEPDPHVWHSAENGIKMAAVVQTNLAKIAPANADLYAQNATALKTELTNLDTWIEAQIATIPAANRKLVTTHEAMGYFAAAYRIPVEGALQGLSTDEKPTAQRVKELVDEVKAAGVPTVFAEASVNPKLLTAVAKEANVTLAPGEIYADGLGEAGSPGATYPQMLMANTKTIVEGLGGLYTPFVAK